MKQKKKNRLALSRFTIAKLDNLEGILGGNDSTNQSDNGSNSSSAICITTDDTKG